MILCDTVIVCENEKSNAVKMCNYRLIHKLISVDVEL